MKNNLQLVEYAEKACAEHWPYCYGTYGKEFTPELLKSKTAQYPQHYTAARMAKYNEWAKARRRTSDCIGLPKGFMWTREDGSIGYGINGCPDTSADGMYQRAKEKGDIGTMPEIRGLMLHKSGHAGVYIGNGYVIEERGFDYGCVKTKLGDRKWQHWYKLPGLEYVNTEPEETKPTYTAILGDRILKKGAKGIDVECLQKLLMELGYNLPRYGADGEYGAETVAAVAAFQIDAGLEADGEYGQLTHAALIAASVPDGESDDNPTMDAPYRFIEITGGTVNVRKGPGTQYDVLTIVRMGDELPVIGEINGWYCVDVNGVTGWVGPKYAKVE